MPSLSGSVVSIMTSTSGWGSPSSTALAWTRGGGMAGKMAPVTKLKAKWSTSLYPELLEDIFLCIGLI